ncbi:transposase [Ornithinimicrobium ciconiae]|uniref:Transposase n=1 Tax=Ornithinimicrobium ciconiae TaxID=2594265 RepID=A0A516G7V4_9MICO|nr:transposase [Ornithinimicrobium ciconiae]QDO87562.1 transposase [Ornithinimicrobium ciconiae]
MLQQATHARYTGHPCARQKPKGTPTPAQPHDPADTITRDDLALVAHVLAHLSDSDTGDGKTRAALAQVIERLRFTNIRDWDATGEVIIAFPNAGGTDILVGLIPFTVPTGESLDSRINAINRSQAACTAPPDQISTHPYLRSGNVWDRSRDKTRALSKGLILQGMEPYAARALIHHHLRIARSTVYSLLTGHTHAPVPEGLDPRYLTAHDFATHAEAITAVSTWIETVYNRRRRHSALGQINPVAFEHRLSTAVDQAA